MQNVSSRAACVFMVCLLREMYSFVFPQLSSSRTSIRPFTNFNVSSLLLQSMSACFVDIQANLQRGNQSDQLIANAWLQLGCSAEAVPPGPQMAQTLPCLMIKEKNPWEESLSMSARTAPCLSPHLQELPVKQPVGDKVYRSQEIFSVYRECVTMPLVQKECIWPGCLLLAKKRKRRVKKQCIVSVIRLN